MDQEKIYLGLDTITPTGWEFDFHTGGYFFKQKKRDRIIVMTINYSNYEPKFIFNSFVVRIRYSSVEKILNVLTSKFFNQNNYKNIFSSTISKGSGWLPDAYRFDGVVTNDDLVNLLGEIKGRINNFALPWIEENNTLEKIGERIKKLHGDYERTIDFGGQFGLYRKLIILHTVGNMTEYERLKKKRIDGFKHLINVENKEEYIIYLKMLEELILILESPVS